MIEVTRVAADRIQRYLESRGKGKGIRLGVRTAGCSGMAYVIEFVDHENPEDYMYESNGAKVFVDPKSLVYLDGVTVDYQKNGLNEGFEFINPNEKNRCGCGESFHV